MANGTDWQTGGAYGSSGPEILGGGVPYGGQGWQAGQLEALIQAVLQQLQYAQTFGYGYPGMAAPTAPTRNDALMAIWQNRPDIQAFYQQNWGDPATAKGSLRNWRPQDAIENWLGMTGELTAEQKADPMAFAIEQGWLVDYSAMEREPTLAREEAEARWQEADRQYLRSIGLDEQQQENYLEEVAYRERRDVIDDQRALQEWERVNKLDAEAVRQYNLNRQDELARRATEDEQWDREFARLAGLDEAAIRQFEQIHALNVRAQEQLETYQTGQLGLAQRELEQLAAWQTGQLGLGQQELQQLMSYQTGQLGLGQQQLGLGYLELLGQQRGPQDWPFYWQTQRRAEATALPAFAQALAAGTRLPPWQAPAPGVPLAGQGAPAIAPAAGGVPSFATPLPQQITPQQWFNMYPSEQAGLQGMVEYGGGYMADYLQQMQRAWPTGQAQGVSYFG